MESQPLPSKSYQQLPRMRFERTDAATETKRDFEASLRCCLETLGSLQLVNESPFDSAVSESNEVAVQSLLSELPRAVELFFRGYAYLTSTAAFATSSSSSSTTINRENQATTLLLGLLCERSEAAHVTLQANTDADMRFGVHERVQTRTAGHMYDLSRSYKVLADVWRLALDVPLHVYRTTPVVAAGGDAVAIQLYGELPILSQDDVLFTGVDHHVEFYGNVLRGAIVVLHEAGAEARYYSGSTYANNRSDGFYDLDHLENSCTCERLTEAVLARLTLVTCGDDDLEDFCSICLDAKLRGQVMVCLPCRHSYHKECGFSWLKRRSSCPLCRTDVLQNENLQNY